MYDHEEKLKQITYELADVNFYREPERFTELFNQFMNLSNESGEGWKNKLSCLLPFVGIVEEFSILVLI